MSKSLSRWQAILLGLCVMVALALGATGLFAVGSRGWFGRDALTVQVGFREIRGVEIGTRVRIQGIDAGEVVSVEPPDTPDGQVVLGLRIKSAYRHLVRVSSTAQIVSEGMIGGKVIELRAPVLISGGPTPNLELAREGTLLASESTPELTEVVGRVGDAIRDIQRGQGTIGKLIQDPQAYEALVTLLRNGNDAVERGKETMTSIQRDADALKKVPLIGGYIEDPTSILVRPNCERNRRVWAEAELFEPGRAVLTVRGRESLAEAVPWLEGLKHKGTEVVVVSYSDPKKSDRGATTITRQQSEAVIAFLKSHKVHKVGWFGSRKVTPLGMGSLPPPVQERDPLPPARVEILVFVPQS